MATSLLELFANRGTNIVVNEYGIPAQPSPFATAIESRSGNSHVSLGGKRHEPIHGNTLFRGWHLKQTAPYPTFRGQSGGDDGLPPG
jgi:hypothetical protein